MFYLEISLGSLEESDKNYNIAELYVLYTIFLRKLKAFGLKLNGLRKFTVHAHCEHTLFYWSFVGVVLYVSFKTYIWCSKNSFACSERNSLYGFRFVVDEKSDCRYFCLHRMLYTISSFHSSKYFTRRMLETNSVGDKFSMLVTDHVTKI